VQEKKNAALEVSLFVIWELQAHLVRVHADTEEGNASRRCQVGFFGVDGKPQGSQKLAGGGNIPGAVFVCSAQAKAVI